MWSLLIWFLVFAYVFDIEPPWVWMEPTLLQNYGTAHVSGEELFAAAFVWNCGSQS